MIKPYYKMQEHSEIIEESLDFDESKGSKKSVNERFTEIREILFNKLNEDSFEDKENHQFTDSD